MHYAVILSVVVHLMSLVEILQADKICKVPNGGAGTCGPLSNCPPMAQIYNKKHKTQDEKLFIRQSLCPSNGKTNVCCPDPEDWSSLEARPIKYPGSNRPPINKQPPTAPKPETSPEPLITTSSRTPLNALPLSVTEVGERILVDNGETVSQRATLCGDDTSSANKITGGSATSVDQYPWLVLLQYPGGALDCGGSLITSRFVLTAAHCIDSRHKTPEFVRLSEYNTTSYPTDKVPVDGGGFEYITVQLVPVESAITHHNFNRNLFINDIGLVKLAKDAEFNDFVKTICLPGRDYAMEFNLTTNFTVAGWGEDPYDSRFNDVKKDVSVPYVPLDMCQRNREQTVNDLQICAGGEDGKDTCRGDSGGPLMYEHKQAYVIVGVVSYGHSICGTKGAPAVYTSVYKYLTWIKDVLEGRIQV